MYKYLFTLVLLTACIPVETEVPDTSIPVVDSSNPIPMVDSGVRDSGLDATIQDSGTVDAGKDASTMDSSIKDASADSSVKDSGMDTSVPRDSGNTDSQPEVDSNIPDASSECDACLDTKMTIGANFWRHTWGNGPVDYFKNNVDWNTTTDPWQPKFLTDLSYAKVLRFMDWGPVNGSKFENWADRVPKNGNQREYPVPLTPLGGNTGEETGHGVAYEWQIDLANKVGTDFWVNVPHMASDDFVLQLARLLSSQLNSNKKIYVEYSNEVWNYGFPQNRYAAAQFTSRGLPQYVTYRNRQVYIEDWVGFGTLRAIQVFEIFEQVFGKNNPRIVKVIASQLGFRNWPEYVAAWGDVHPLVIEHMAVLQSSVYNPRGMKIDAYALAPYWNGNTVAEMRADLSEQVERTAEARRALDSDPNFKYINLIFYEGGQDGSSQLAAARDPAIYSLTYDAYSLFKQYLTGPFVIYTHVGWDQNYAWGLKQSTAASTADSHKYRATLDWVRDNP